MPSPHPILAWLAPTNPIESAFARQAADASDALDRLSGSRPEIPDAPWLRTYTQAQTLFRKALSDLEKLRKTAPTSATSPPAKTPTTAPTPPPPSPTTPAIPTSTLAVQASPLFAPRLNRQERRRLEAYKRSSHGRQAGLSPRAADAILSPSTP